MPILFESPEWPDKRFFSRSTECPDNDSSQDRQTWGQIAILFSESTGWRVIRLQTAAGDFEKEPLPSLVRVHGLIRTPPHNRPGPDTSTVVDLSVIVHKLLSPLLLLLLPKGLRSVREIRVQVVVIETAGLKNPALFCSSVSVCVSGFLRKVLISAFVCQA
jgi:hypothetical protein